MKATIITALTFLLSLQNSPAHEGVELGPNGGRILELSDNETLHGEVTAKDGTFHISLLDKDMKAIPVASQILTATSGDRSNPEKLTVTTNANQFLVPMLKGDDFWVIFQFRENDASKKITARLHYEAKTCEECQAPEWLCKCAPEEDAKK